MKKILSAIAMAIMLSGCPESHDETALPMLTKQVDLVAKMKESCGRTCSLVVNYYLDDNLVFNSYSKMYNCTNYEKRSVALNNITMNIFSDGSIRYEVSDVQDLDTTFTLCFGEKPNVDRKLPQQP